MFIMQLFVGGGRIDKDGFAQVTGMSRGKKGRDRSLSCENLIHKKLASKKHFLRVGLYLMDSICQDEKKDIAFCIKIFLICNGVYFDFSFRIRTLRPT